MIRSVSFEKTTYAPLPAKFEAGTPHIAGAIALGVAIDYVRELSWDWIRQHEHGLLEYATAQLASIPGLRLIGIAREKAAVLSFVMDGVHAHDIGTILDQEGIAIRAGHHCTQPVMERLGIDLGQGGADPELKAELVREAAASGRVVMVGDGVNDAAALAAATVGVGVHGGAEATLAAADVFLGEPGLEPLVRLLDGSRRTLGVIRRNLVFSLTYNVVAVALAMLGLMNPLVAAVLMPASSITVVVSSYRARTFT